MSKSNTLAIETADREVILTRIIDAPRELVFDAWTQAKHIAKWFGPHGFRVTAESDPRVGGNYHITMHGTDQLPLPFAENDYPVKGSYLEFVRPERLVYTSDLSEHPDDWKKDLRKNCEGNDADIFTNVTTVIFEDVAGTTKLTLTMRVASNAIRDGYLKMGMKEGWEPTFEKLEDLLAKFRGDVIVERVLDAPVERVWDAISNNDKMKHWYFQLQEFRPEVGFEFEFEGGPPEKSYIHECRIVEVIPQQKLAYTWRFRGYEGDSVVSFELFPEGNKTRVRLTHAGLDTFAVNNNPGLDKHNFVQGWTSIIGKSLKDFVEQ